MAKNVSSLQEWVSPLLVGAVASSSPARSTDNWLNRSSTFFGTSSDSAKYGLQGFTAPPSDPATQYKGVAGTWLQTTANGIKARQQFSFSDLDEAQFYAEKESAGRKRARGAGGGCSSRARSS